MRWFLTRLLQSFLTMLVALVALFIIARLVPGDPLGSHDDQRPVTPAQVEELRRLYGLDQPLGRQLIHFLRGAMRGDLGTSIQYGRPVAEMVAERIPASLLLGGAVLLVNFTLGLWLGVVQARRRGEWSDRVLTFTSLGFYSMPSFWLGLMLILVFGLRLRWFPVSGLDDLTRSATGLPAVLDRLRHLVLPAATLSLASIAASMRFQRGAMIEALAQPWVTAARARGLAEDRVVWGHAWRSALSPVLVLFGLWLPIVVVGSVFVEQVFAWPGLGSLAASAAGSRDYPLLMGTAVLATGVVVLGNLTSDALLAWLDPRVRTA